MARPYARALSACAFLACASLLTGKASAELPRHPVVLATGPGPADIEPEEVPPEMGAAVVIRNGQAFVGMPAWKNRGAVRLFTQTSSGWVTTATLTGSDTPRTGDFGRSLTMRDGILVVGAANAAYVFQRGGGVWKQVQKLTAPAADNTFSFADALRYEDGTLAVGASGTPDRSGAVYVFVRDGTGKFVRRAKLLPSDSRVGDEFGRDISMAGPVMVVGGSAAYVFRRNSSGQWRQHQKLTSTDNRALGFGAAVAIDRGMIIVGAPSADSTGDVSEPSGAAYVFVPTGAGQWVETLKIQPRRDEIEQFKRFGQGIAMFDKHIAILSEGGTFEAGDVGNPVFAFSYIRSQWNITARGVAVAPGSTIHRKPPSLALANNWILLGYPCSTESFCSGGAAVFDFNRFQQ
jgi:hypothetical protein